MTASSVVPLRLVPTLAAERLSALPPQSSSTADTIAIRVRFADGGASDGTLGSTAAAAGSTASAAACHSPRGRSTKLASAASAGGRGGTLP